MYPIRWILTIVFPCFCLSSFSQKEKDKIKFGEVTAEDFAPAFYPVDSSADAVYLFDVGSSKYTGNNKGYFSVVFERKFRIRLLHKNSFDLTTVKIFMETDKGDPQKLEEFEATTFNVEDGKVAGTKLDRSAIFEDKEDGYKILKFTFPNVKEGSIIDCNYKIISPYYYYMEPWTFQTGYPKLLSEYTVHIPQMFRFMTLKQGYLPYTRDTVEMYKDKFFVQNNKRQDVAESTEIFAITATVYKHTWAIEDVPAMKQENYITTMSNYRSSLSFQLSEIDWDGDKKEKYLDDWKERAASLMASDRFGLFLNDDLTWLKGNLEMAKATSPNLLENAGNIYKFVQNKFAPTYYGNIYLTQSLRTTDLQHKGSTTDLNMFLIALLRASGLEADPVMLSTRAHGRVYDAYPIMSRFNYVIARVKINGSEYLLDASNKALGFGQLGQKCYNGNARAIIPASPVLVNLSADSLKETSRTMINMFSDGGGKISGSYTLQLGNMESLSMKELMLKESKDDYIDEIKKAYRENFTVTNAQLDSIHISGEPVTISYELATKLEEDIVYFNPMLQHGIKENPFAAATRFFPVEMPYATDDTYIFNMEVPEGYKVDELPKSARINFNDGDGSFDYIIAESGGRIQLNCRLRLNKANFSPEDYESLRGLYSFIVQKEGEQIVFKKIQ